MSDVERRVVLTSAATVRPEPVRYALAGRVAFGTGTLVVGDVGLGKTTLLIEWEP